MGVLCTRRALVMLFIFNIILLVQNWYSTQQSKKIEALIIQVCPQPEPKAQVLPPAPK